MTDRVVLTRWRGDAKYLTVPPLHWTLDDRGDVLITCGNGHLSYIDHEVDAEGNINPSLLCRTPHEDGECGWHVFARMEGWGDGRV